MALSKDAIGLTPIAILFAKIQILLSLALVVTSFSLHNQQSIPTAVCRHNQPLHFKSTARTLQNRPSNGLNKHQLKQHSFTRLCVKSSDSTKTTPSSSTFTTNSNNNTPNTRYNNDDSALKEQEQELSDVDSRVLESLLRDAKVDLQTEQDIQKLLERGTIKTVASPSSYSKNNYDNNDNNSKYSSKTIKKLSDNSLWKELSLRASNLVESLSIWVVNKVESDVQTLAALGLFAWDRAVQDVARALPAAGENVQRVKLLLSNSSSYDENEALLKAKRERQRTSVLEDNDSSINKPAAEIQRVTTAVWDILTTDRRRRQRNDGNSRGLLRTVAPAGSAQARERQQRAFVQRQKLRKQERDVTKWAGGVVDTAYEFQRELQAETSVEGYKTKEARAAIAAGAQNLLSAVKARAQLAAAKRQQQRLLQEQQQQQNQEKTTEADLFDNDYSDSIPADVSRPTPFASSPAVKATPAAVEEPRIVIREFNYTALLLDIKAEMQRLDENIQTCIVNPGDTWLRPAVVAQMQGSNTFEQGGLREVVTSLILTRDSLEGIITDNNDSNNDDSSDDNEISSKSKVNISNATMEMAEGYLDNMFKIRNSIEQVRSTALDATCVEIADALYSDIMYLQSNNQSQIPLILRLEELQEELYSYPMETVVTDITENFFVEDSNEAVPDNESSASVEIDKPYFMNVQTDAPSINKKTTQSNTFKDKHSYSPRIVKDKPGQEDETFTYFQTTASKDNNAWFTNIDNDQRNSDEVLNRAKERVVMTPEIVDVVPEVIVNIERMINTNSSQTFENIIAENDMDALGASLMVELVSDDDFEVAVGKPKVVKAISDEEAELEEQPNDNAIVKLSLRALDIIFLVIERFVTVVLPKALLLGETASQRIEESTRDGKGAKGWKTFKNTANPKGRY